MFRIDRQSEMMAMGDYFPGCRFDEKRKPQKIQFGKKAQLAIS
jgi:hypothetical protein